MPSIQTYLQQILDAVYGEEVRGAIHDAIEECYTDVTTSATSADAATTAANAAADAANEAADEANAAARAAGAVSDEIKSAVAECAPLFTENLIANTNITSGYVISPATGKPIAASEWNITDYIELRPGIPYHRFNISLNNFAFYDAGKNYIDLRSDSRVCSENKLLSKFVLPDGVMFGRFTIHDSSIGIAMLSSYDLYDSGNTVDGRLTKTERIAFAGANAFMAMRYKDGESTLSEHMYKQGSVDSSGNYVTYNYGRRIISKYLEWYPFDVIYTPSNGARMFYLKFSNGAYVLSAWTSSQLTIPAKTSFLLCVESASSAQVAEICQMVTAAGISLELPSYYYDNRYINNKIDTIIGKSPLDGLQFAFITDVHVRNNAGISPDLIKYIKKNTNAIPFVIFGGDVLITTVEEGVDVREDMRVWQTWMNKIGKNHVYQAQGNHDYLGYHYVDGERVMFNESLSVCRQLVIGNLEDAKIVNAPGKLWYYVDIPTANTRIVFLNDYDTTRNTGVFYGYNGMSVDQVRWVVENALDTDGIRVIFVSHQTYDTEMQGENQHVFVGMQSLFTAIANHTTYSYGAIQKDFTNSTIEFVAHICGHMHADASNVNNGVLTIQTTCDAYYGRSESIGTIAEQAFDIVTVDYTNSKLYTTRIGSGNDREFDI